MPIRSRHFCTHAGCRVLTSDTYCAEHAPMHLARIDYRGTSDARGYDSRWQRARERYLRRHPLCEQCEEQERFVIASVVHHIVPLDQGGARLDPENFMATCRSCHEIIHGRKREN